MLIIIVDYSTHRRGGRLVGHPYGAVSGQIWLDDIQCNGTEISLAQCRHNGWGIHNCGHNKDVSISCNAGIITNCLQFRTLYDIGFKSTGLKVDTTKTIVMDHGHLASCKNFDWT